MSITLWCELCCGGVLREGCTVSPSSKTSSLFCYISLLHRLVIWNNFFLTTHSKFSVLNFKLKVQTYYPLSWMFFFHTVATVFPTSSHMKTVCSCRVWKLRCMSTEPCSPVLTASFGMQNNWLEKKADQSLCVRKEALGLMLMSIMPMIRCYIIGNVQMCSKAFYFSKVGLGYIGNSAISL